MDLEELKAQEDDLNKDTTAPVNKEDYDLLKKQVEQMNKMVSKLQLQISQENEFNKIKAEHGEIKEGLLQTQGTIANIEMFINESIAKSNDLMEYIHKENVTMGEYFDGKVKDAFGSLDHAVREVFTSNQSVKESIGFTFEKYQEQLRDENKSVVMALGIEAVASLKKSLGEIDGELKDVSKHHKSIVDEVRTVYRVAGYLQLGLWTWRFLMLVMMMELVQGLFQVDSFWGWVKVVTGLGLFL